MPGREAEPSKIGAGDAGLCDWITAEVSQIILEELIDIIGRITDRLTAKFEERTIIIRVVREVVEIYREGNLDVEP